MALRCSQPQLGERGRARALRRRVSKTIECCIKNEEVFIKNEELSSKNEKFGIENDELCSGAIAALDPSGVDDSFTGKIDIHAERLINQIRVLWR